MGARIQSHATNGSIEDGLGRGVFAWARDLPLRGHGASRLKDAGWSNGQSDLPMWSRQGSVLVRCAFIFLFGLAVRDMLADTCRVQL